MTPPSLSSTVSLNGRPPLLPPRLLLDLPLQMVLQLQRLSVVHLHVDVDVVAAAGAAAGAVGVDVAAAARTPRVRFARLPCVWTTPRTGGN